MHSKNGYTMDTVPWVSSFSQEYKVMLSGRSVALHFHFQIASWENECFETLDSPFVKLQYHEDSDTFMTNCLSNAEIRALRLIPYECN